MKITKCALEGCRATTTQPGKDGWIPIVGMPGLPDGLYCPKHSDAILLAAERVRLDLDDDDEAA